MSAGEKEASFSRLVINGVFGERGEREEESWRERRVVMQMQYICLGSRYTVRGLAQASSPRAAFPPFVRGVVLFFIFHRRRSLILKFLGRLHLLLINANHALLFLLPLIYMLYYFFLPFIYTQQIEDEKMNSFSTLLSSPCLSTPRGVYILVLRYFPNDI